MNYQVQDGSVAMDSVKMKDAPAGVIFANQNVLDVFPRLRFTLQVQKGKISNFIEIKNIEMPIRNLPEQITKLIYGYGRGLVSGGDYYIDTENNLILNDFDSPDGTHYIISSKADKYKWTLTKETKKISGYICYKAITQKITNNMAGTFTKPVTAWYAPSIPLSFGPKDYNGLPGLILELQEGTIGLYATKIDLNPKEKIEINKPTKGKLMTQEEYDKSNGASYERAKNLLGG